MELFPEALILFGGAIVTYLVGGIKAVVTRLPSAAAPLVAAPVGIGIAALVYGAGFVDTGEAETGQVVARAALAGIAMAMSASGVRAQVNTLRG